MNDLKPFEHGEEGTHTACKLRIETEGEKARCCFCVPHSECFIENSPDEFIDKLFSRAEIPEWANDAKKPIKDFIQSQIDKAREEGKNMKGSSWREGYERGKEEIIGGKKIAMRDALLLLIFGLIAVVIAAAIVAFLPYVPHMITNLL